MGPSGLSRLGLPRFDKDFLRLVPPSISLLWIMIRQQSRGWRWRGLLAVSLLGAWWYGRTSDFGPGSTAWFPGGPAGLVLFTIFLAAAGVLLGVELLGQWERHRAMDFIHGRLRGRWRFLLILLAAGGLLGALPMLLITYWAPIGAWRAGFGVRWQLSAIYFAAAALPLFLTGLAWGMAARAVLRRDIGAQVAGLLLVVPACWFRLEAAPIREVFTGGGFGVGVRIPTGLLIADALVLYGYAVLGLGMAGFAFHHLQADGGGRGRVGRHLPSVARIPPLLAAQARELGLAGIALGLLVLGVGVFLSSTIFRDARHILPASFGALEEPDQSWRAAMPGTELPALPVAFRRAELPEDWNDPIHLWLTVDGAALTVPLVAAGVSFGGFLEVAEIRAEGIACRTRRIHGNTFPPDPLRSAHVLFFDPPLPPGEDTELEFILLPPPDTGDRRFHRRWREAFQPGFQNPAAIGTWYGTGYRMLLAGDPRVRPRLSEARTPFEVTVPQRAGLRWIAGTASREELDGGRLLLRQSRPASLDSLVAGPLVSLTPPPEDFGGLPLRFELLEGREDVVRAFSAVNQRGWTRLGRLFAGEEHPIVLHETPLAPGRAPGWTALSMEWLDRLETLHPRIDHPERPARHDFVQAFRSIREGLVRELIARHMHGSGFPELLEEGLAEYLIHYALRDGSAGDRRDYIITPWETARAGAVRMVRHGMGFRIENTQPPSAAFTVPEGREDAWTGPANPRERESVREFVPKERYLSFHHQLRGRVGDDAFVRGLRTLWQWTAAGVRPSTALYRDAMEEASGEDLRVFFAQWLDEGILPKLRIVEGQALLLASADRRSVEYTISVQVENRGSGTVRFAWGMATEGEDIRGTEWIGPGEVKEVRLRSLDRPVMWELDPEGWLPRSAAAEGERRLFFRTIREL